LSEASARREDFRPLTVGEILDRALRIHRRHFRKLFLLMLAFHLPVYVLTKAFEYFGYSYFPHFLRPGLMLIARPRPDIVLRELIWLTGAGAIFWAVSLAIYDLRLAATAVAGRAAFLGEPVTINEAFARTFRRAAIILGTSLVQVVWYGIVILLAALPGLGVGFAAATSTEHAGLLLAGALVALALCEVPTILWLLLRYSLVAEVVMLEGAGFVKALRRSGVLMRGRASAGGTSSILDNSMLRASVVFAVTLAVNLAAASPGAVCHSLVDLAYGNNLLNPTAMDPLAVPAYAIIPIELADAALESAVAPFALMAGLVFYFDLRIRKEGFDLELLAEALQNPS
jgi:hypothetical protein